MFSRNYTTLMTLAVGSMFVLSRTSMGQIIINFDEKGNGTAQTPNGTFPLPAAKGTDPVDPGNGLQPLIYNLAAVLPGFLPPPGDIDLIEPPVGTGQHSDLLRWTKDTAQNPLLIVYSDKTDTDDTALADVGIPLLRQGLNTVMNETGVEGGLQGMFGYAPVNSATDPGWFPTPPGVIYNFTSDYAVPEPTTAALFGLATGLSLLRRRR
jgi:hypothetical protein